MRTAASIKSLMSIKDVTREDAVKIRNAWLCHFKAPMATVDQILKTSGIEYLGEHKRTGKRIWYCNAGDSYGTTVLFVGEHLRVGCWADLPERNMIWEPNDESRPGWPR